MSSITKAVGGGLGTILFIIFLTLKLAEIGFVATWSWWWVFAPLWVPILLAIGFWVVVGILALLVGLIGVVGGWLHSRSTVARMMRE